MRVICFLISMAMLAPVNAFAEIGKAKEVKKVEPEISSYLKKIAKKEDPQANPYISSLVRGDIDGDGKQDAFVSYAIEGSGGGNLALYYQALFLNDGKKLVFRAERENGSSMATAGTVYLAKQIEQGKVICDTETYAPDDDSCCPSIKGKSEILFENGKLVEAKQPQK